MEVVGTEAGMEASKDTEAGTEASNSRVVTVADTVEDTVAAVATTRTRATLPAGTTSSRVMARDKPQRPPLASPPRRRPPATTRVRPPSRDTAHRPDTASRDMASNRYTKQFAFYVRFCSRVKFSGPAPCACSFRRLSLTAVVPFAFVHPAGSVRRYAQGYGATGGQTAAATGYGTSYAGTEAAGNGSYGTTGAAATGYGTAAVADQGGYGAYRGGAATQGRQDRSYRPY